MFIYLLDLSFEISHFTPISKFLFRCNFELSLLLLYISLFRIQAKGKKTMMMIAFTQDVTTLIDHQLQRSKHYSLT